MHTWLPVLVVVLVVAAGAYLWLARPAQAPTLANPASVNCEQTLGGSLQITETPAGQIGYCHLPDGRVCEEWALYQSGACTPPAAQAPAAGYKDATYLIQGTPVKLVNGIATSSAAPGSAAQVVTRYFGNEASGDLNGDGAADAAFILTQESGGSGTFYYAVAALKTPGGWVGTNGVLLGDRIAPQSTHITGGELIVNYADRKPGQPMSTRPSQGATMYLRVQNGRLTTVQPGQ